jgi:dihydrofolate synthase/folylpolyglutamate synthase
LAFDYFRKQQVDVAVIETGLGGRLDSTNIVEPEVAVLTPIDFDHEKQLGNTLDQIAAEKAGIIKAGAAVFSARQPEQALSVFKNHIRTEQSFWYLPDLLHTTIETSVLGKTIYTLKDRQRHLTFPKLHSLQSGDYQVLNQSLAYAVSRYFLEKQGRFFSESAFRSALANQVWAGRLQLISRNPDIILDVSHNPAGIEASFHFIRKENKPVNTLIGLVDDKNYEAIAATVARYSRRIIITEPETHRKLAAEALQSVFVQLKKESEIIKDSVAAFELLKRETQPKEIVLAIGSHYLIGRLLRTGK